MQMQQRIGSGILLRTPGVLFAGSRVGETGCGKSFGRWGVHVAVAPNIKERADLDQTYESFVTRDDSAVCAVFEKFAPNGLLA